MRLFHPWQDGGKRGREVLIVIGLPFPHRPALVRLAGCGVYQYVGAAYVIVPGVRIECESREQVNLLAEGGYKCKTTVEGEQWSSSQTGKASGESSATP